MLVDDLDAGALDSVGFVCGLLCNEAQELERPFCFLTTLRQHGSVDSDVDNENVRE